MKLVIDGKAKVARSYEASWYFLGAHCFTCVCIATCHCHVKPATVPCHYAVSNLAHFIHDSLHGLCTKVMLFAMHSMHHA